jgi:hypothetical protein
MSFYIDVQTDNYENNQKMTGIHRNEGKAVETAPQTAAKLQGISVSIKYCKKNKIKQQT